MSVLRTLSRGARARRPRIAAIGSEWFHTRPGGLNRYFDDFLNELVGRDDCEVLGFAFGASPGPGRRSLGRPGGSMLIRLLRVLRIAQVVATADMINTHFALYGFFPALLGRVLRKQVVVHFHGPWADESRVAGAAGWKVALLKASERIYLGLGTKIIVLSDAFKSIVVESYGIDPDAVEVVPGAVNDPGEPIFPHPDNGSGKVICVRRLEHRMGIDVLLHAWQQSGLSDKGVVLEIIGTGTQAEALHALADGLGVDNVVFRGRLSDDEMDLAYRTATVSVVPTRSLEGFGLVVLESLVRGVPCITSTIGGLPEVVAGLEPPLLVAPEDASALAAALQRSLAGQAPTPSECREHALRYSWSRVVTRFLMVARHTP